MPEANVLGQLALGYGPIVDRQRAVVSTRLTVFPGPASGRPDAAALLQALDAIWPGSAAPGGAALPPLCLNPVGEDWLRALLGQPPAPQRIIEVPAFIAADPAMAEVLAGHAGNRLMLKGQPLAPLPAQARACFSHVLVEDAAAVAPPAGADGRPLALVRAGVHGAAQIQEAFAAGAVAVAGWPAEDAPPAPGRRRAAPPDAQVVLELIDGVNRDLAPARLEGILRRDPNLAYRLMLYLNSPAFALPVEVTSLSHALMLLGREGLKRWLVVLLAGAGKDVNAKPLLFMALRRGLVMEELVRPQGDATMGGELFLCGIFSLLDRLLGLPLRELLAGVLVPERVQQALADAGGPYLPYLQLVRALERQVPYEIRQASDALMLAPAELNRAVLAALASARQLD